MVWGILWHGIWFGKWFGGFLWHGRWFGGFDGMEYVFGVFMAWEMVWEMFTSPKSLVTSAAEVLLQVRRTGSTSSSLPAQTEVVFKHSGFTQALVLLGQFSCLQDVLASSKN